MRRGFVKGIIISLLLVGAILYEAVIVLNSIEDPKLMGINCTVVRNI